MLNIYLCKTYSEAISKAAKKTADFGKDLSKKMFAFCEDKLTMSLEREVATACGGGTFNVQVSTFSRFIKKYSKGQINMLDKESSAMAVKNILLSSGDCLTCFGKSAYNPGTAITLYELIAQLKSANVTPDDLNAGMENLGGVLAGKIKDISFVYTQYESYIKSQGLYDSNSYLALMPEIIKNGDFGKSSAMLVGFSSFTRQGMEIVKALAENMAELHIFLLYGENGELYTNELFTALTKGRFMRDLGDFSVFESDLEYSIERKKIMDCLFEPTCISSKKVETDKVFIYDATDHDDEINHIASVIRREIIGGLRYKDIAVAVGNPQGYKGVISRIFGQYGIPYFLDNPRALSDHPLAKFAVESLDVIRGKFALKDVFTLVHNPYFGISKEQADEFENYCLKNALTPKSIKSGLYRAKIANDKDKTEFEAFENVRIKLMEIKFNCSTVSDYADAVISLFEKSGAQAVAVKQELKLKEYGDMAAAAFTKQVCDKAVGVLNSVKSVLGANQITITDFRNILISGFSACQISVIPQMSDAVYIGDYKECKYIEHKILFAAGLNGDVPFTKSDTAILTDKDLNKLERFDCIVEPKIEIVNRREKENVGAALLSFSERLYLSRSATGADGRPNPKGRIIDYFVNMFTCGGEPLTITSGASLNRRAKNSKAFERNLATLKYNAPRPALKEFLSGAVLFKDGMKDDFTQETAYINALKGISVEQAERAEWLVAEHGADIATRLNTAGDLIIKNDTLSASILETYFGCPFACFMRYGLKLKNRQTGEVQVNEFGNLLHSLLEEFVKQIKADKQNDQKVIKTREDIPKWISEKLSEIAENDEYVKYLESDKYKTIFTFIEKEGIRVAVVIYDQFEKSAFIPIETEAGFGGKSKRKPLLLNTPYGVKKVSGKIDRVDRMDNYIRIIDYKTGKTHESDESFYTGNNIQLFLYMNAFLQDGEKPAGAYYFPVSDKFEKPEEHLHAMRGKTLLDDQIIIGTDNALDEENRESGVLGLKLGYNGRFTPPPRSKALLGEDAMDGYLKYAIKIAEQGAAEISEGIVAASPYEKKCEWCEYADICGFDISTDSERKERDVTDKTILEAVK